MPLPLCPPPADGKPQCTSRDRRTSLLTLPYSLGCQRHGPSRQSAVCSSTDMVANSFLTLGKICWTNSGAKSTQGHIF